MTAAGRETLAADRRRREGWLADAIDRDLTVAERRVLAEAAALLRPRRRGLTAQPAENLDARPTSPTSSRRPPPPTATVPAIVYDGGATASYAELDRRAAGVAALLVERGVAPATGSRCSLRNGAAFVAAYFGALRAGAVVVPLNLLLAPPEIAARLEASGARAHGRPLVAAGRWPPAPVAADGLAGDRRAIARGEPGRHPVHVGHDRGGEGGRPDPRRPARGRRERRRGARLCARRRHPGRRAVLATCSASRGR